MSHDLRARGEVRTLAASLRCDGIVPTGDIDLAGLVDIWWHARQAFAPTSEWIESASGLDIHAAPNQLKRERSCPNGVFPRSAVPTPTTSATMQPALRR